MPKVHIQNFGCRATQADGTALETLLATQGFEAAREHAEANLVILNTCTVTAAADEDVRSAVRRVHRENPEARILVTGCYAQRAPEELAALPGVTWVVGNSHKTAIPDLIADEAVFAPGIPYHGGIHVGEVTSFLTAPVEESSADRTRPNLKIQDGCSNRCSFCIIPSVRGRSRSLPADEVVGQVARLAPRYREVVLSGINLGRWGREQGMNLRLAALLRRLLDETPIERIRLSSVEPMDFTDALLAVMAESPRIAKHVHAPLQSGSDAVLRRMRRKYRSRHYEDRVRKAHELMPDAAIGADVMTGFPGETDAEFEENRAFIASLPFTYLHVFTYSERPGTEAAGRPDQVPMAVRRERTRVLRALGAEKNLAFRRRFVGRSLSVVTLGKPGTALSDNYLSVELAVPRPENLLTTVLAGSLTGNGLREASPLPVLGAPSV
ncbi:MAG TPA: tRNA (N(6)-L-threonylcarbamoyladenosine(37)-C(2))-methylthiotransferase MtaB [Solibacterales bacterium]|nr:tRNA (N(6)-L-threonylcarbamoyladenosine(37)-C(2))-methylthiotransferase MtaB [Bryobacterales bacterium]